jgi:long-chain acyl-CoA synthetase
LTLKDMLETAAQRYGEKTAIICGERLLAFTEFDRAANKMASALKKMGVSRGQRVAMLLSSSPEFAVVYFGIVKIGAIAVPLDTKYKTGELSCLFDDCRPSILVTENPYLDTVAPLLDKLSYIKDVIDVTPGGGGRFQGYESIMAAESGRAVAGGVAPDDVAHIAYTSGPTFRPRGVMLTHGNLVEAAAISAAGFRQTDKDIVTLFALPMHHAVGLVVIMLTSLYAGSAVIMLSGLSIHGLLETIEREKATIFMGVPFVHSLLLREVTAGGIRHDIGSLRLCASAGAPLPLEIIDRYRELLGRELIQFYGLTEATCHVTCQPLDGGKDGYVGRALPGFQIKVVDDAGRELGSNQPGEIIIKGPIMSGYYNKPQATAEAIKDGWLYTGDIGSMDEEGDIVILGLKKPMLIVKGQNIYHSDVEDVLANHPKVVEVAVVGIADPEGMRGEVVRAVIRLKPGQIAREAEIKRYCLARLANYKVPKQVIFVANLPRITGGKVDKKALEDLLPSASSGGRVSTKII